MSIILDEAKNVVYSRQASYGVPEDSFAITAELWSAYLGAPIRPEDVGMMMILLKVARERYQHKKDNLVDIAGYVECVARLHEKRCENGRRRSCMTKQDLKEYTWIQRNIEKLEQRIEELHAIATKQTSPIKNDADSIHGTGYHDRIGEILAEMADLRTELQRELQKALQAQLRIEQAIKDLPEREKYLIRARYIEQKTWEQIAVDMGYSWRGIHKIHAGALKLLA